MPVTSSSIVTRTLKSWEEIHQYRRPGWIYRGHEAASWNFETTLERCCNRHSIPADKRLAIERELCREFRRAYHQYALHVPNTSAIVEWLSLMQHYGAPTRLLDFTYSIYVAAYFAAERATQDCAVWALNPIWALEQSVALLRSEGKQDAQLNELKATFLEGTEAIAEPLFIEIPTVRVACPINPFRLNERLRIQKGVFLIPGNVEVRFMENLSNMPGYDDEGNLVKLVIPASMVGEARKELFDMNITRRSLFPGLEGYAQALGVYHPVFNPDEPIHKSVVNP
jgi:hypothetical protein